MQASGFRKHEPSFSISCLCLWLSGYLSIQEHVMLMITNLIEPRKGKLMLNHLTGKNCPEVCIVLLDTY